MSNTEYKDHTIFMMSFVVVVFIVLIGLFMYLSLDVSWINQERDKACRLNDAVYQPDKVFASQDIPTTMQKDGAQYLRCFDLTQTNNTLEATIKWIPYTGR